MEIGPAEEIIEVAEPVQVPDTVPEQVPEQVPA